MKLSYLVALLTLANCYAQPEGRAEKKVGGPCEDCDLIFAGMPEHLDWQTQIADASEPGERLIIHGTIFKSDGTTPAAGVILYVYHTNHTGHYSPAPDQQLARRHGHLRGWMKTNAKGQYQFTTIRPAAYPNRKDPQHIHPLIKENGKSVYWIDEFLFEDDPLLTSEVKGRQSSRGGSGIIKLNRLDDGTWVGERNIILGKGIPNY